MFAETAFGSEDAFVEETKGTLGRISGTVGGESVECLEPAVVGVLSVLAETRGELDRLGRWHVGKTCVL